MSELKNITTENDDKYYLEEQELWDNLGFDWEGWNATVKKILQQQSATNSNNQE